VKWALRMVAERRQISRSNDMLHLLAEHGLDISKAKMSQLWTGQLNSVRLDDLEIICTALNCTVEELLIRESPPASSPPPAPVVVTEGKTVRPVRRSGRTTPP
jgi:putative transcriptional regulator